MPEYRRTQVNDQTAGGSAIPAPEAIRQVAAPIDTYYKPTEQGVVDPRDPNSMLKSLAEGLMKYEPQLQRYVQDAHKEWTKAEIAKGEAARRENQQGWKDAVARGEAPVGANPWQMKGYMNQTGKLDAMDYAAQARTDIMKDPVWGSNNPAEVKAWMDKYRSDYLKKNGQNKNRDWSDGFEPGMAHGENTVMAQHIAGRQAAIAQGNIDNVGLLTTNFLDAQGEAERDAGGYDTEEEMVAARKVTAAKIEAQRSEAIRNGSDGKAVNNASALSIINKAKESDDVSIIDDYIMKGPRPVTPEIRALAESARTGIIRDKNSQILQQHQIDSLPHVRLMQQHAERTAAHTEKDWERMQKSNDRGEEERGLFSDLFTKQRETGKLDPVKLRRLGELDPQKVEWLIAGPKRNEEIQNKIITDPIALANMRMRVLQDPNVTEKDLYSGVYSGRWTVAEANAMEDKMHAYRKEGEGLTHDPKYQTAVRTISAVVGGRSGGKKQMEDLQEIPDAITDYREGYVEIYKTNPKKLTPMEQNDAEVALREKIRQRYAPDVEPSSATKATVQGPQKSTGPKVFPVADRTMKDKLLANPTAMKNAFVEAYGMSQYEAVLAEQEQRRQSIGAGIPVSPLTN